MTVKTVVLSTTQASLYPEPSAIFSVPSAPVGARSADVSHVVKRRRTHNDPLAYAG